MLNIRITLLILIAFMSGMGVLVAILTRPPAAPQQAIYLNGVVITMDAVNTVAEAVLVREGQIEAVGTSDALLARIDDEAVVVDL